MSKQLMENALALVENAVTLLSTGGPTEEAISMLGSVMENLKLGIAQAQSAPSVRPDATIPVAPGRASGPRPVTVVDVALQVFVASQGLQQPRTADQSFELAEHFISAVAQRTANIRR